MNYGKKITDTIGILAMSLIMIPSLSYVFFRFVPTLISVILIPVLLLVGSVLTYKGLKHENKSIFIFSMVIYNISIASFVGGFYRAKMLQINILEFIYLTLGCVIVILSVYFLFTKFKNRVAPALISILVIALSVVISVILYKYSIVSEQSKVYMVTLLILGVFHYIIALVAMKKDIDMIKAISMGCGVIFLIVANVATEGIFGLPGFDDEKEN